MNESRTLRVRLFQFTIQNSRFTINLPAAAFPPSRLFSPHAPSHHFFTPPFFRPASLKVETNVCFGKSGKEKYSFAQNIIVN